VLGLDRSDGPARFPELAGGRASRAGRLLPLSSPRPVGYLLPLLGGAVKAGRCKIAPAAMCVLSRPPHPSVPPPFDGHPRPANSRLGHPLSWPCCSRHILRSVPGRAARHGDPDLPGASVMGEVEPRDALGTKSLLGPPMVADARRGGDSRGMPPRPWQRKRSDARQ
jgi:hypothetical protein